MLLLATAILYWIHFHVIYVSSTCPSYQIPAQRTRPSLPLENAPRVKGVAAGRSVHRTVGGVQADGAKVRCRGGSDLGICDGWIPLSPGLIQCRHPRELEHEKPHNRDRQADEARDVDRKQHEFESEREEQHVQRPLDTLLDAACLRWVAAVARRECQRDADQEHGERPKQEENHNMVAYVFAHYV